MAEPAAMLALPGLIRATRASVEANAPDSGVAGVWRAMLIGCLLLAEGYAEMLAALIPAPEHLTAHVPAAGSPGGWPPAQGWPAAAEPLVPRRTGHDQP